MISLYRAQVFRLRSAISAVTVKSSASAETVSGADVQVATVDSFQVRHRHSLIHFSAHRFGFADSALVLFGAERRAERRT